MADTGGIRVVVVDDDEIFLESVVRLLVDGPAIEVVGTALTAVDGVAVALSQQPDIVILDYQLPDAEGPNAIRAMKSVMPGGKVITLTGSEVPGGLSRSMRAGSSAWVRKSSAVQDLRDAIRNVEAGRLVANEELQARPQTNQLVLHYQPIVELQSTRIVGFEALVRWQHPDRGLLHPCSFLPIAEETGFITEIDRWAREQATLQLLEWQGRYPGTPALWMSVNLSARDLADDELFDSIAYIVKLSGINPADLVVEITESVLLDERSTTSTFLNRLKDLGVGLSLDDFGTAFSSLSYIQRFPFDHLKIDTSFTAELPHSVRSMLLVEAIHHLAWSVGMVGIAEGIEREEQATALRDIGWTLGQGHFFSPPVPVEACEKLLAAQHGA
jgi:EAL domain-containing protein (putative c-di-GMP-specific phosphodiesterase class I)